MNKLDKLSDDQEEICRIIEEATASLTSVLNNIEDAENFDHAQLLLIDTVFDKFRLTFEQIKDCERYKNTFLSVVRYIQDELLEDPKYLRVLFELDQLNGKANKGIHYFNVIVEYCDARARNVSEISQYIVRIKSFLSVYQKINSYKIIEDGIVVNRKPVENEAHFEEIQNRILKALDLAKVSIRVAIAWFTNRVLRDKLVEKMKQGVDVYVAIYDDGINKKHGVDLSGIPHKLIEGTKGGIMHNKFCVIDNQIVITGSYNWSANAETRNDENVTVSDDPGQATKYSVKFRDLLS